MWNADSTLTLRNDTIVNNKTTCGKTEGGGVYNTGSGTVNIFNTIVAGNSNHGVANDISSGVSPIAIYNVQYSLVQKVVAGTINGVTRAISSMSRPTWGRFSTTAGRP